MSVSQFAAAFHALRVEAPSGRVFVPGSPIDIEWVVGVSRLAANRWFKPLVDFEGPGPESRVMRLSTLTVGQSAAFVFLHGSGCATRAIAAVIIRDRPRIFAEFLRSLLAQNGADYGVLLFGNLPAQTVSHAPTVIGAEVIADGYLRWIEWAETLGVDPWAQVAARAREGASTVPTGRRSARVARLGSRQPDLVQERAHRTRTKLAAASRHRLLRRYLSITYSEASR